MKTSTTTLMTAILVGTLGFVASASACGGGGYGGGYGGSYGYNNWNYNNHKKVVVKKIYIQPRYDQCYHPDHCFVYVFPGDTWGGICQREYGNRDMWRHLVSFNGFRPGAKLVVGQKIMLPVINADGSLAASTAPAGLPFVDETPAAAPIQSNIQPSAPFAPSTKLQIESEPSLPSVSVGSTVTLDGQEFGDKQGVVRLRISGLALPAEVIEWTATSAKVKLPTMDLASSMRADIEVVRADGSVASQSAIQLTPTTTSLALGN